MYLRVAWEDTEIRQESLLLFSLLEDLVNYLITSSDWLSYSA